MYHFVDDASDNPTFYADPFNPQSLNKYQYGYNILYDTSILMVTKQRRQTQSRPRIHAVAPIAKNRRTK